MPTIFTHAVVGAALGRLLAPRRSTPGFLLLCAASSALPDADVLGRALLGAGVFDPFPHRGLTHSLFFAAAWGTAVAAFRWRRDRALTLSAAARIAAVLALVTATHGLLDTLTDGGSPIALLAPFSDEGFFAPWRPIPVAPIDPYAFFGPWGLRVLGAEVVLVWLPALALLAAVEAVRRRRARDA